MRRKIFVCLGLGIFFCLSALAVAAQAQEQEAQLYFVREIMVKPSKVMDYFEGTTALMAQIKEHKFPYPINVFRCDDFSVVFSAPLENIADMQNLGDSWDELMAMIGPEQGKKIQDLMDGTSEFREDGLIVLRPDLSYTPESPRLKPEEVNFYRWSFAYLLPGKAPEFEETAKKYVPLMKSKNIPDGYVVYQVIMGKELPLYVLVQGGKNPADYFSMDYSETLGEEAQVLQSKLWSLMRKMEYKNAWIARDLSYDGPEK
ncbi:MAG: hypothetical protein JSV17_11850 [Candidatus Aminicenantes bacterium]|nr:MAG: hypothetical protein JSV17_11850 [Candidatus Aminicenantes bacterium]